MAFLELSRRYFEQHGLPLLRRFSLEERVAAGLVGQGSECFGYDDALSRELTEKVETANLQLRSLGFKPYVAPAVSSGAMQLLLTLRGDWHCSSIPLGDVWFGVKNRFTPQGLEMETLPLPDTLFARLQETEALLKAIV